MALPERKVTEFDHPQSVSRMKDIAEEVERIGKKDALTKEDELRWADLNDEFEQLDKHRKHLERAADLAKVRDTLNNPMGKVEIAAFGGGARTSDDMDIDPLKSLNSIEDRLRGGMNPWDLSDLRTYSRTKSELSRDYRSRALSAIEKMPATTDRIRAAATGILESYDDSDSRIAKLCLATSSPEYLRAWSKVAAGKGHMISQGEQAALERAMSLTDSAGGYLVPFQLDPTVIITANGSRNQIRQISRTVVATGDVWNGVSAGAVAWSWDAEAAEVSDDSPTFGQPSIPVYKAAGFVPISIEALEDAANVTSEVAKLLAFGKDVLESAAFTTGSGVGQPTGVVTALAGTASEVAPATPETFASADVYAMDSALPARYRSGASWLANRGIYNRVRNFDANGGAQLWERIGADVPPQLLGRPAYEAEDMDGTLNAAATETNYPLIYGDFENYVIADRIGMTVEFIPHLFHTANNRPMGQRGWYAYYRVGADVVNEAGFRMLAIPTTA